MTLSPKKKTSIYKKHRRHSARQTINLKKLSNRYRPSTCNNCGKSKLSHQVCPHCGFYAGKQIITIKSKTNKVVEA